MTTEKPKPLIFHPERLQKLSDYLRTTKRNRSFEVLEDDNYLFDSAENPVNLFPVFECSINALPKAFPQDWIITEGGIATREQDERICCLSSIIIFFGIDRDQFMHLFTPYAQDTESYGGKVLLRDATPIQIADNISDMISFYKLAMQLNPEIKIFISKN